MSHTCNKEDVFRDIKDTLDELKVDMKAVKEQVLKTNGRVTALEKLKMAFMGVLVGTALAGNPAAQKAILALIGVAPVPVEAVAK